jgi:hypothetical protein
VVALAGESPVPSGVSSKNIVSPLGGVILIDGNDDMYYWE